MSASLIAAALIAASAHATAPDPAPVVAAERAFAADGLKMGVKPSFLKHSRPDAIMISDQPRTVTQVWCGFFVLNGAISMATAMWSIAPIQIGSLIINVGRLWNGTRFQT